jgi:hypothetical protein
MALFRKRKDEAPQPETFEQVCERALTAIGREYDLRDDHVDIKLSHGWRGYHLGDVRARCEARPPDTWLGIVTRDLRATVERDEREPPLPEFEQAKGQLKLRMHAREQLPAGYPLGVPFGPDLVAALTIDRGESAKLVGVPDANEWARPFDELLRIAHANSHADLDEHKVERIDIKGGGGQAVVCSSERWFAATQALWPDRLLDQPGRHGALVAAPNPFVALAHAIDDHRTRAAIEVLVPWAQRRVEAVENPISPHLYWWRPGKVVRLDDERRAELEALLGPDPSSRPSSSTWTRPSQPPR